MKISNVRVCPTGVRETRARLVRVNVHGAFVDVPSSPPPERRTSSPAYALFDSSWTRLISSSITAQSFACDGGKVRSDNAMARLQCTVALALAKTPGLSVPKSRQVPKQVRSVPASLRRRACILLELVDLAIGIPHALNEANTGEVRGA
jgi:hypothetical protein